MRVKQTNIQGRDKLYTSLDAYCRTMSKRSVNYTIEPYSEYFASITIQVSGKRATAQKKIIVYYDTDEKTWIVVVAGIEYYLVSLSEITSVLKTQLSKLTGWVNKF